MYVQYSLHSISSRNLNAAVIDRAYEEGKRVRFSSNEISEGMKSARSDSENRNSCLGSRRTANDDSPRAASSMHGLPALAHLPQFPM